MKLNSLSRLSLSMLFLLNDTVLLEARSTGAGSGGDVLDSYLASARQTLYWTLNDIERKQKYHELCECRPDDKKWGCSFLSSLSKSQKHYCRYFIQQTAHQYKKLIRPGNYFVPFLLSSKKLWVPDPYGKNRPVLAVTNLGVSGPVTFYAAGLRRLWPASVIALIGHELGHKVEFGGLGNFVADNTSIGPFGMVGGGRLFLDAVGWSLSRYAVLQGWVPTFSGIEDYFSCEIKDLDSGANPFFRGYSPRMYDNEMSKAYSLSVGWLPRDLACNWREKNGGSHLSFRIKIQDAAECSDPGQRWTKLSLLRVFKSGQKPLLLLEEERKGWTPLCDPEQEMALEFETENGKYQFIGEYERRSRIAYKK